MTGGEDKNRQILQEYDRNKMGCFNDPAWTTTTRRVCGWWCGGWWCGGWLTPTTYIQLAGAGSKMSWSRLVMPLVGVMYDHHHFPLLWSPPPVIVCNHFDRNPYSLSLYADRAPVPFEHTWKSLHAELWNHLQTCTMYKMQGHTALLSTGITSEN